MNSQFNIDNRLTLRHAVNAASIVAAGIGIAALLGWIFDVAFLKSILPNAATMKFNTALGLLGAGVSLWLLRDGETPGSRKRAGQVAAVLTASIGLLSLTEYLFGWNLGIDQLFVNDPETPLASFPGRMSLVTALCFSLCGFALLIIDLRQSQYFSIGVVALSLLALIGYLFDSQSLYLLAGYGSVAVHTAIAFLILSLGMLAARPWLGVLRLITSNREGGRLIRLLLPLGVVILVSLGWLVNQGEKLGFFDVRNDMVILIVLLILVYSPLIYFYAGRMDRAEEQVDRLHRLYAVLSHVNQAIVHAKDRETLYKTICKVIVQFGEFRLAWIGVLDVQTGEVHPVALQGVGTELIRSLQININHSPFDTGLLGRAIRSETIATSDDVQTDQTMIHWRKQSSENGFRAVAVIPFRFEGQTMGVLSLFASEAHFFQREEERLLLEEIGSDISFALETLQAEAARSYLASIVESSNDAVITKDLNGRISSWNKGAERIFGYSADEIIGQPILRLIPADRVAEEEQILSQIKQDQPVGNFETMRLKKDGTLIDVSITVSPVKDKNRTIIGASKIARDITQRKQAEQELARATKEFQVFAENSLVGIFRTNTRGQMLFANDSLARMLEFASPEELLQQTSILRYKNVEDRAALFGILKEQGSVNNYELQILTKYNRIRDVLISATLEGTILSGTTIDITERSQAEERFRLAIESAPNAIVLVNQEGKVILVNSRTEVYFGYLRAELVGKNVDVLVPERFRTRHTNYRTSFYEDPSFRAMGVGRELYGLRKDGSEFPVEIGLAPIEASEGTLVLATVVDITERKHAEERFRLAIESAPNAIVIVDQQGKIVLVNARAEKDFGYARIELIGQNVDVLVPERMRGNHAHYRKGFYEQPLLRSMGVGRDLYGLRKDRTEFPVEIGLAPLESPIETLVMATIVDITERKSAEERFRLAIESAPNAIVMVDGQGEIILINPKTEEYFGYSLAELIGRSVDTLVPTRFHEAHRGFREGFFETPEIRLMGVGRELYGLRKDHTEFPVEIGLAPIETKEGLMVMATIVDITERRRAQAELQHTLEELQRSNTELEQFAYVASHDLQEPLRTITGMVQLLQKRYQNNLDARADEYIRFTVEAASRMQALINDLLEFSRVDRRGQPFEHVDINAVIQIAQKNLATTIRDNNALITYDPLPTIQADRSQMTRLFQNLIGNAIKFRKEQPPQIHVTAMDLKDSWQFSVRDNGIGIEPQHFERIFVIFQRLHTRNEYSGTGIGLSLCKKIVERHGGRIWVESEPGQGSTFYFTLAHEVIQ